MRRVSRWFCCNCLFWQTRYNMFARLCCQVIMVCWQETGNNNEGRKVAVSLVEQTTMTRRFSTGRFLHTKIRGFGRITVHAVSLGRELCWEYLGNLVISRNECGGVYIRVLYTEKLSLVIGVCVGGSMEMVCDLPIGFSCLISRVESVPDWCSGSV